MFVSSEGVAANCASALAQMAAASCVQEEKEEREAQEPSDAIAQGNSFRQIFLVPLFCCAHILIYHWRLVPILCVMPVMLCTHPHILLETGHYSVCDAQ